MELDFSWMDEIAGKNKEKTKPTERQETVFAKKDIKTKGEDKKRREGEVWPLQRKANKNKLEIENSLSVYKKYQENTIQSGKLQTEIIKGTREGESIFTLFLKAIQAISLMTSDPLFYATVEENMLAIYGEGLKQEKPLKMELEAVERRLKNLMDAIKNEDKPEDVKRRIEAAIKAHKERARDIQTAIEKV